MDAPLIAECHFDFECQLYDSSQIDKHALFMWEMAKAHVAITQKIPQTVHYRDGRFMVSGPDISRRSLFKPQNF